MNFNFLAKKPKPVETKPVVSQTREPFSQDFFRSFENYDPLKQNPDLIATIRSTIPIFDVAFLKKIRLMSDFDITTDVKTAQTLLDDFQENVRVNYHQKGLYEYWTQLMDAGLEQGNGWGEIIPTVTLSDVWGLKNVRSKDMGFLWTDKGVEFGAYRNNRLQLEPVEHPEYINSLAFDQRQGHPVGYSMIFSCVYASQVFYRWEKSFENQLDRFGDISLVGLFKGGLNSGMTEVNAAASAWLTQMKEWSIKKRKGQMSDISLSMPNGGDIDIRTLGADAVLNSYKEDVRTIIEQLVAKTGLPPYMLGLSWSTTERMSQQQADMIQATIKADRMDIDTQMRKVIDSFLILNGKTDVEYELEWGDVLLQDEKDSSLARLQREQAIQVALLNLQFLQDMDLMEQDTETIEQYLIEHGAKGMKLPRDWKDKIALKSYRRELAKELLE
jgi:hypothetical protein